MRHWYYHAIFTDCCYTCKLAWHRVDIHWWLFICHHYVLIQYKHTCLHIILQVICTMEIICKVTLIHWGRVTHKCNNKLMIIGSDNGLLPGWHQAIIWTNAGIFSITPWGTTFRQFVFEIQIFSFKKMHLKTLSAKWKPFCLSLNVLLMKVDVESSHMEAGRLSWILNNMKLESATNRSWTGKAFEMCPHPL